MIYEMCSGSLESIANQWQDLSLAFKRLAVDFPKPALIIVEIIGNPKVGAAEEPKGMEKTAIDESVKLKFEREKYRPFTAAALLQAVPKRLEQSRQLATNIRTQFNGLNWGKLLSTPNKLVCDEALDELIGNLENYLREFEELGTREGDSSNLRGIRGSVEDIASYPILTSDMGAIMPMSAPSMPGGGAPSLQRRVDDALRQVLGRLPRTSDPRSFRAALMQSFSVTEIEGHIEFAWTPRSYAGQTELGGGVTGAQASLYARAKVAADNALPLLDGLRPLLPDYDDELVTAVRSIVRTQFSEIVGELGVEGGPRVTRVNILFKSLTKDTVYYNGKNLDGYLVYLSELMGLIPDQVNTLEEETMVTNFVVIKDYVTSLQTSWENFRSVWLGKDLGTRLVLLSRALSVTAEAVQEVWAAMDSVFVGSAERQVARFRDDTGNELLVEELLSWIVAFASEEAPALVHEGGRRGVIVLIPTAIQLERLVTQFIQSIDYDPLLPVGLRHPRVKNPLRELRTYLQKVQQLAQDVQRPVVQ
jgi:hypothetical protein